MPQKRSLTARPPAGTLALLPPPPACNYSPHPLTACHTSTPCPAAAWTPLPRRLPLSAIPTTALCWTLWSTLWGGGKSKLLPLVCWWLITAPAVWTVRLLPVVCLTLLPTIPHLPSPLPRCTSCATRRQAVAGSLFWRWGLRIYRNDVPGVYGAPLPYWGCDAGAGSQLALACLANAHPRSFSAGTYRPATGTHTCPTCRPPARLQACCPPTPPSR